MADANHYWDEMDDLLDAAADDPGVDKDNWAAMLHSLAEKFANMAEAPQVDRAARVNRRREFAGETPS